VAKMFKLLKSKKSQAKEQTIEQIIDVRKQAVSELEKLALQAKKLAS
jgi:hypothetical protein